MLNILNRLAKTEPNPFRLGIMLTRIASLTAMLDETNPTATRLAEVRQIHEKHLHLVDYDCDFISHPLKGGSDGEETSRQVEPDPFFQSLPMELVEVQTKTSIKRLRDILEKLGATLRYGGPWLVEEWRLRYERERLGKALECVIGMYDNRWQHTMEKS